MDYTQYFQNKHITLMGLGVLGRGVGDAKFLAEQGAEVVVTDLKTEEELAESVRELEEYANISFVLGEHREQNFINTDLVIKAAGVPLDSPYITAARKAGVPVCMSSALFAQFTLATIVGVTGTRGKTTTSHLIADILRTAGKRVFLGGNTRGVSTLAHLPESTEDEIAVLELDSWQLQGFGEAQISPHVAVFTNLMRDHMNYYGGDMERYLADKAQIFLHQNANDILITNEEMHQSIVDARYKIPSQTIVVGSGDTPVTDHQYLFGEHNQMNMAMAAAAARQFDISDDAIEQSIRAFTGVEGRLAYVTDINGVAVYNDTTATTPDATLAALRSFKDMGRSIVLIMGGTDKELDMGRLGEEVPAYCKDIILLPGTATDKIKNVVNGTEVASMEEAVSKALQKSERGDVVLLSPGSASFGLFQNEYDRGDQFVKAIQRYEK